MIVNALYEYYETLLNDQNSGVSPPGFSKAKVGYCLVISNRGELLNIIDLRVTRGNKLISRVIDVPEQLKRASNIAANFLCDNCAYVLGLTQKGKEDKKARVKECFNEFVRLHNEILGHVPDEGAAAFLAFLNNWQPGQVDQHPVIARHIGEITDGSNLVFKMEGDKCYLHERKAVLEAWRRYKFSQVSDTEGQCLVTGKRSTLARLHPSIKGVTGAQSSGASLVSFNLDAFTSYGKEQSYNAPVSEEAAFGYTTALNYLLSNEKHRIRIGDTTVVFWAEKSTGGLEEDLLGALFFPSVENNEEQEKVENSGRAVRDPQTVTLMRDILSRIKNGLPVRDCLRSINEDTRFYILGLAPNASRLAVRFWHVDPYIAFIERIGLHYRDLAIIKSYEKQPDFISVDRILKETAPRKDTQRIAPLLGGALMRAILTGTPYPMVLYNSIIARIRADREVNYVRASMIKACLIRNKRFYYQGSEVELTVSLNEDNRNTGYLLGRLFALLEKAQSDANPGINATIRDRYFSTASASPGSVFPILLRLAQHHITKAEYGHYTDKRIEEVVSLIDCFPAHLNLEEQGQFVLGYYQQRQALYQKTEKKESANQ